MTTDWDKRTRELFKQLDEACELAVEAAIRADEREKASREIHEAFLEYSRATQAMIESLVRWYRTPLKTAREAALEEALRHEERQCSCSQPLGKHSWGCAGQIARRALEWGP